MEPESPGDAGGSWAVYGLSGPPAAPAHRVRAGVAEKDFGLVDGLGHLVAEDRLDKVLVFGVVSIVQLVQTVRCKGDEVAEADLAVGRRTFGDLPAAPIAGLGEAVEIETLGHQPAQVIPLSFGQIKPHRGIGAVNYTKTRHGSKIT